MGKKACEPHRKFPYTLSQLVALTLQPVLWGWCKVPNFQNDSFANELYATLQTPAMHRRDYFDTEFEASKVRMCLHKQVWMNACALHILKGRCKRSTSACTQLGYLFLDVFTPSPFSFPLQRRLTNARSMLGKWFAQFIYYFTLFYLKNSNRFTFFPLSLPKTKINFQMNFQAFKGI